jgi:hypothetical protein
MGALLIRIEKKRDGTAAMSCRRADGTVTWQRGFLDREHADGDARSAAALIEDARLHVARQGVCAGFEITDEELARIRAARAELFERWRALAPGEALEVEFAPPGVGTAAVPSSRDERR